MSIELLILLPLVLALTIGFGLAVLYVVHTRIIAPIMEQYLSLVRQMAERQGYFLPVRPPLESLEKTNQPSPPSNWIKESM